MTFIPYKPLYIDYLLTDERVLYLDGFQSKQILSQYPEFDPENELLAGKIFSKLMESEYPEYGEFSQIFVVYRSIDRSGNNIYTVMGFGDETELVQSLHEAEVFILHKT